LAALTDFMDGFIARKFNQKSSLGRILDPIADKILIFITYFGLYFLKVKYKPGFFLLLSIIVKEILIISGSIYLLKIGKIPEPTLFGKISVALLMFYGGFLLLLNTEFLEIENLKWFEFIVISSIWLAVVFYLFKFFGSYKRPFLP